MAVSDVCVVQMRGFYPESMRSQQKNNCPQRKNADMICEWCSKWWPLLDLNAEIFFSAFFSGGDFSVPRPRSTITVAALEDTAEKLLAVGTQLTEVALKLKQASMTEALLPWTNAHWRSVDKLVEVGTEVDGGPGAGAIGSRLCSSERA